MTIIRVNIARGTEVSLIQPSLYDLEFLREIKCSFQEILFTQKTFKQLNLNVGVTSYILGKVQDA